MYEIELNFSERALQVQLWMKEKYNNLMSAIEVKDVPVTWHEMVLILLLFNTNKVQIFLKKFFLINLYIMLKCFAFQTHKNGIVESVCSLALWNSCC